MKYLFIIGIGCLLACQSFSPSPQETEATQPKIESPAALPIQTDTAGMTISSRFAPPAGATRSTVAENSFAGYLRNLPLYPASRKVHYFNGDEKYRSEVAAAVVNMDVGTRDLQQCADAVMRLRAEYLYEQSRYSDIEFHFTNGFFADYDQWRAGKRISVKGNDVSWYNSSSNSTSYKSFRKYLNMVFAYASTISLRREMNPIQANQIDIGDVFVESGSPGHAVVIVDKAVNEDTGAIYFMVAQSYMPAQDIHVLINPSNLDLSPWYKFNPATDIYTPEWSFEWSDLHRFKVP